MPELKLGAKFECFSCGTKFYDLGKSEPICPKCGANQKDSVNAEAPTPATTKRKRKTEVVKPVEPAVDDAEATDETPIADEEIETPEAGETDDEEEEVEDLDDED
jgi:uncharacterized protein (TIGR02300 family)